MDGVRGAFRAGQIGGGAPETRNTLFLSAHASISVPSTEKCSSDISGLTCGWFRSLVMNLANTYPR
jgi:hypothetical protein